MSRPRSGSGRCRSGCSTGRNYLNEREQMVQATGMTRDEVLLLMLADADDWLKEHGPKQDNWVPPFTELETTGVKR
jgi:hypothetical protein